jgi:predicted peptidase
MRPEIEKGFLIKTAIVDGREFRYVVYVPPIYCPGEPTPAIVFLHGIGECGTDGLQQILCGLGSAIMLDVDEWPFIVIFPQKPDPKALWADEEPMVMAALDKTRLDYNVDGSRIYLTGLSQGGHGTWAIGASRRDIFAAIAPICGRGGEESARKLVGMPIWAFHGEADSVVPVSATLDMAKFIEAAGGSCKLTIYPGVDHNSWDRAYREDNLAEWFLEHSR